MLLPKRVKWRKQMRGRMTGHETRVQTAAPDHREKRISQVGELLGMARKRKNLPAFAQKG